MFMFVGQCKCLCLMLIFFVIVHLPASILHGCSESIITYLWKYLWKVTVVHHNTVVPTVLIQVHILRM